MHNPWVIDNTHLLLRLILSVLLGGLVGYERERNNHAAGLRTHTLVCLGSCLIMILSIYGFSQFASEPNVRLDPARLAAQVITGIGFLGAGTIVITGKGISGLTTAASVWVVMAVGLAVGAGFYFPAITAAVFVLFILWGLNIVEKRYVNNRKEVVFWLAVDDELTPLDRFQRVLEDSGGKLLKVNFPEKNQTPGEAAALRKIQLTVLLPHREILLSVTEQFRQMPGVRAVSAE